VLDASGEVRIPVPADFHEGDRVHIELSLENPLNSGEQKSWSQWLDSVEGIFEDHPLEVPSDPVPEPVDVEG